MSKVSIDQINETLDRVAERLDRITEAQKRDKEAQQRDREAAWQRDIEAQQMRQREYEERKKEYEERQKERDELDKKRQREYEERQREYEERKKEQDKSLEELKKTVNKFAAESNSKWGRFVEVLASSNAMRLLHDRGIKIDIVLTRVQDVTPNRRWEIDVLAINGKEYVAIEVKNYLRKKDVDKFIKVLHDFKKQYKDCANKLLYGGVAYLECEERVDKYAEEKGLFIFQATGNSATLNNRPDFKPKPIQ